jgi:protein MpaA
VPGRRRLRTLALLLLLALLPGTAAAAAERSLIGRSVHGRPIVSFRSGAVGPVFTMLVFGSIHGDEIAGMRIARRLIAAGAPPGTELVVVPMINPDGVAAGTRGNARGVDLNRNFPSAWPPLGGGEYSGPRPLSEPESQAARRLILRIKPEVTIWFHQPFGLVDRPAHNPFAARRFAQLIGLPLVKLPGRYPGSASRWQNHVHPRNTAFVVELPPEVNSSLTRRATAAVLNLAAELTSPELASLQRVAR